MRPTFSPCRVRRARAATPGMKYWCTSSITATGPATSWKFCQGSTSTCGAPKQKARPPSRPLELQIPELGDDVLAPAAAGLARCQPEPSAFVDVPCGGQHAVRPQSDLCVTFGPREAHAVIDKPGTQSKSARFRIHQQQAQPRDIGLIVLHQHDTADVLAVHLGDPAPLALGIEIVDEIGNDLRAQALKWITPAVLVQIKLGVT